MFCPRSPSTKMRSLWISSCNDESHNSPRSAGWGSEDHSITMASSRIICSSSGLQSTPLEPNLCRHMVPTTAKVCHRMQYFHGGVCSYKHIIHITPHGLLAEEPPAYCITALLPVTNCPPLYLTLPNAHTLRLHIFGRPQRRHARHTGLQSLQCSRQLLLKTCQCLLELACGEHQGSLKVSQESILWNKWSYGLDSGAKGDVQMVSGWSGCHMWSGNSWDMLGQ